MGIFSITPAVAEGLLNGTGLAEALGATPQIRIYNGTPPASAAASLSGNTLLVTMNCSATPISGWSDTGTAGRATFDTVSAGTPAATGTATFFRILKSDGTTVIGQGDVGTSGQTLVLETTSIVIGSGVSVTAFTIDFPYGP